MNLREMEKLFWWHPIIRNPLVVDVATGQIIREVVGVDEWLAAAVSTWYHNRSAMAVTSLNDDLQFWTPDNGKVVMSLRGAGYKVVSLQVAKNIARIALGVENGLKDRRLVVRELPWGRILPM